MKKILLLICIFSVLQATVDLPLEGGTLNLRDKHLAALPDFAPLHARAHEVTVIDCSHNDLLVIPSGAFAVFTNLQEVILHHNSGLTTVSPTAFADNKQLRLLDMRHCGLTALPPDLLQDNVLLEVLLLGHNELAVLPALTACKQLHVLEADHNVLTELPDCHQLAQLAALVLDYNVITDLSPGKLPFGSDHVFHYLFCAHNQIAGLAPEVVAQLPVRGVVDLRNNPCWEGRATKDALAACGYVQKHESMTAPDTTAAERIASALHEDMSAKFLDFLSRTGQLPHEYPLRRLLAQRKPIAHLRTGVVGGINFYRRHEWWLSIGAGILVGGGIGVLLKKGVEEIVEEAGERIVKKVTKYCAKRILGGAFSGGAG
ncbi:MAG: leucine-rich repeat domain-containing protein, partial [Candidatus Dependentiae bacterium]